MPKTGKKLENKPEPLKSSKPELATDSEQNVKILKKVDSGGLYLGLSSYEIMIFITFVNSRPT